MRKSAFTIVELLVVMSLIVLLIALMLPLLGKAREIGRDTLCKSNLRGFGVAFVTFATDNDEHLPGAWANSNWTGPEHWQWSWLAENGPGSIYSKAPHTGSVFTYLASNPNAYRCPSLIEAPLGSGLGSNGRFDYSMLMGLAGATLPMLPTKATNQGEKFLFPLMVEEEPATHLNGCCVDGGHSNVDRMGTWHLDGGNLVTIDGGVHRIERPAGQGLLGKEWEAIGPQSGPTTLGYGGGGWGLW